MQKRLFIITLSLISVTLFASEEMTLEQLKKNILEDPCTECLTIRINDPEKQTGTIRPFLTQLKSLDKALTQASTALLTKADKATLSATDKALLAKAETSSMTEAEKTSLTEAKNNNAAMQRGFALRVAVTEEYSAAIRNFIANEAQKDSIVSAYGLTMTKLDNQYTINTPLKALE